MIKFNCLGQLDFRFEVAYLVKFTYGKWFVKCDIVKCDSRGING